MKLALAFRPEPYEVTLTDSDAILYALSIGLSRDPMNTSHFRYTYENHQDFSPFPLNVINVCHRGQFGEGNYEVQGVPSFNPMKLLFGEEDVTFLKPLKQNTKYVVNERMEDF